ncbi:glycosyltransferase family 39 protein [Ancylobacter mangrovi]|uniref:glycosyltransferase family 39 protein n=1 Tax=Ancylobacter mangrovi TaxID=2972472 RepID=UPI0021633B17|nr:glycosyltransferase family 39 protein [Ancylobacter mangrovi]MCS0501008.1 glycosyltransferase family 39 protein [Ancylobacter mangrovi]
MLWSALWIEALRARPGLAVRTAGGALGLLWVVLPLLVFASPPLELTQYLLAARAGRVAADAGGPLAAGLSWLALDGLGLWAVYALFALAMLASAGLAYRLASRFLGRAMGGAAALVFVAVEGIGLPLDPYAPDRLALPAVLWVVLESWRLIGERKSHAWPALAAAGGIALFAGWSGWAVVLAAALLIALTPAGRAALRTRDIVQPVAMGLTFLIPFALWTVRFPPPLPALGTAGAAAGGSSMVPAATLLAGLVLASVPGALLVLISSRAGERGGGDRAREDVPTLARGPMPDFAPVFMAVMGIVPLLAALALAALGERQTVWGTPAPALLAVLLVAGRGQMAGIHRRRAMAPLWLACVAAPAVVTALVTLGAPQVGRRGQAVNFPARAVAGPLTEAATRRLGHPPGAIGGVTALAAPIALASSARPVLMPQAGPAQASATVNHLAAHEGMVLVWPVLSANGGPPYGLRELWPDLQPQAPIVVPWAIAGRLDPVRVGWAVVPPRAPK